MNTNEHLVDLISRHIAQGAYRVAERLPSLREFSQLHQVSIARAIQVYAELADRGLVEVRDRAGYFVAPAGGSRQPTPNADWSGAGDFESFVVATLGSKPAADRVSFSAAYPGGDLFPIGDMHRMLRTASRVHRPSDFVYEDADGLLALRQRIARLYANHGERVSPAEIVPTSGGMEAVQLALSACTSPGESAVGVESPSFYPMLQALRRFGLRPVALPTGPTQGLDVAAAIDAMKLRRVSALLLMPTFHNPLGCTLSDAAKQALAQAAAQYGVAIVENDPYRDLYFGDVAPNPIKHFDESGWVLHCGSFSNTLAPGYSVGWLAAGRFQTKVRDLRFFTNMTAGLLPQRAVAAYLSVGGARGAYAHHLVRLRATLKERVAFGLNLLGTVLPSGAWFSRPQGGFMVWVRLHEGVDTLALNARAQTLGISLAPGPVYSLSSSHRNNFALNFGWDWNARRVAALEQLGPLIAKWPGERGSAD